MDAISAMLPESAAVDRAAASEARMDWSKVPAKAAVYLLACGEEDGGKPLLLATVGNLRAALQRRLADSPAEGHSKRVEYGKLCGRVYWRVVHSSFAADFYYWMAARVVFPQTYREIISWRPAWWVAVEKSAQFPKLRRTQELSDPALQYAGPIGDKFAAGKAIETVEDLFDLCRYHNILVQAPAGKACAYKEMGKCPAPCDGSVPLSWYHGAMGDAFRFLSGETRVQWSTITQEAMRAAAARQEFELANRIKQRLTRAATLNGEAYRFLRPLSEFSYLSLQPGRGRPYLEPWVVHGGEVAVLEQIKKKELAAGVAAVVQKCRQIAAERIEPPIDREGVERIAIVTHHLFRGERDDGVWIPMRSALGGGEELVTRAAEAMFAREAPRKPMTEQASDRKPEPPPAEEENSAPLPQIADKET